MSSTVEITTLNLRYETHRMRESAREARLLALIAARGIRQPLEGVDTADGRFLLNGFKRLRCARQLSLGCVPYESIAADIECFLKAVAGSPLWCPRTRSRSTRICCENCIRTVTASNFCAKAGEERSFWTVETNFLPGRRFSSLEDLNQQGLTQLSCHLPAPYCLEERSTDQYGFMAYNGKATGHKTGSPDSECCRVTADQVPPISGHVPPVSISSESPRDSAAQTTCWTAGPSTPLCLPVPDPRRLNQVHRVNGV